MINKYKALSNHDITTYILVGTLLLCVLLGSLKFMLL